MAMRLSVVRVNCTTAALRARPFHGTPHTGGVRALPPNVVMGEGVTLGHGVTFEPHATRWTRLHNGVTVGARAHIAAGVTVGAGVTIPSECVVARDVRSDRHLFVQGAAVVAGLACLTVAVTGALVVGFEAAAGLAPRRS